MSTDLHPYSALTPDTIMDAVESLGFYCDHRLYPLNSYENRVYQVGIENSAPLIAKFYRPKRWSAAQIQAEHDATLALKAAGVGVAAPMLIRGKSLFQHKGFYFSLTPKIVGEAPEPGNLDQLFQIGELIGAMHQASADWQIEQRPYIPHSQRIERASNVVLQSSYLPSSLRVDYVKVVEMLQLRVQQTLKAHANNAIRFIHGDCHRSNLIAHDGTLTLLDFDDCRMGYAVQDLWLHISDANEKRAQLSELIEGYESHCDFDTRELDLIDVMMADRTIVYTAWIAERWSDPAFPTIFPHFASEGFWLQHLQDLNEVLAHWGQWR
ncbi:serine/threonine protein kinase [Marinomonas aquimarina]|uniref:Stress response kinase A n=1 Tax=Marinomonas aquimarina TaxID=295068 RepID=A0A1A8T4Y2_9GAMM|nr:serine/threonine protein kinase [Marinomonas aquimarina]SBS26606.1 serine/threonine protein kinase [Marinomonas aquimarina]